MEIALYAFTVMYTPGPVNLIGLNSGLTDRFRQTWGFFLGVGLAMFVWFLAIGFLGQYLITDTYLSIIACVGAIYILYLSYKIATSPVTSEELALARSDKSLTFVNGFTLQLLNPKNSLVVVPITTVMFPGNGIAGNSLVLVSAMIAIGGAGAPALYFFFGQLIGSKINNPKYFVCCNYIMAFLLVVVALMMIFDYVIA